jgi:alpha-ribazole phosphatase/probable phosphoglycerate mutase
MRWFLVRHGETEWNAVGRMQGQTDIPLSDVGRAQASRTGQRLASVSFGAAYASDLSRASETAAILLDEGRPVVTHDEDLREVHYGAAEGRTWADLRSVDAELYRYIGGLTQDVDYAPAGGESVRQLFDRQLRFVGRTAQMQTSGDVLVVAHGGSLRALAITLIGLEPEHYWHLRGLGSASVSIISDDRGRMAIHSWNETAHLD